MPGETRRAAATTQLAIVVALALGVVAAPVSAQQPPPAPDAVVVTILVRNTMLALSHASLAGSYSVFRDLGSPGFQQANSSAYLGEIYADMRRNNIDLSPLAVVDPQLTQPARIDEQGRLRLIGFFPTRPLQVEFDLAYDLVDGRWRLSAIAAGTVPAPVQQGRNMAAPLPPEAAAQQNAAPTPAPVESAALAPAPAGDEPQAQSPSHDAPNLPRPRPKRGGLL